MKKHQILAIETSHDDTSIALYFDKKIVWEKTLSQVKFHEQYGGTVPEFASRQHVSNLSLILNELISKHDLTEIDQIAYTANPGLIGSLQMGYLFAAALSLALTKPLIPINHLHGHVLAIEFTHQIKFPALALIVSGGHSQIWLLTSYTNFELLGETHDDALGEAYDKVARMLGLGFPGGPKIDKLFNYQKYHSKLIDFKIKLNYHDLNLSFSGIKTKVLNYINKQKNQNKSIDVSEVATSFQYYAVEYVLSIFQLALKQYPVNSIILGGGVAANSYLRQEFSKLHPNALIPEIQYTTDNASMIAIACDLQNNK